MSSSSAAPTATSPPLRSDRLLRQALGLDAAVTGLNGAGYAVAGALLNDTLGLPAGLIVGVGAFLLGFAVAVWRVGSRATVRGGAVRSVIAANLLWVAASIAVIGTGWNSPTTAGTVWIGLQAAVVAGFSALQAWAVRSRSTS